MLLMAVESACIPFPSELIMPLAGWMLIKDQSLPVIYVLMAGAFGAIGNTVGSVISYYVGMWAGRPLLNKYGRYILISRHDLDIADRWFSRSGGWTVFISRLLPVVRTYISLPAGIAGDEYGKIPDLYLHRFFYLEHRAGLRRLPAGRTLGRPA